MWRTAALAIAFVSAAAAQAADESNLYLYGAAGWVRTDPGISQPDADAAVVAAGGTNLDSTIANTDTGFKVQIGWRFNKNFALEAGYVGLGSSRYRATFTDGSARSDLRAGGIVFAMLGLAPVTDDFSFFARVGVIAATVVTSFDVTGPAGATTHSGASNSSWEPNYGVGAIYDLSKSVSLRLEFERFPNLGNGQTTTTSTMDMVSLGVMLRL